MLGKAAELYLVDDDNTTTQLNDAALAGNLQTTLNTTTIEFVSEDFTGKETSITFDETDGVVTVNAKKIDDSSVVLYPRP